MRLINSSKDGWWKRFWGMGAKAAVVALVVILLLPVGSHAANKNQTDFPKELLSKEVQVYIFSKNPPFSPGEWKPHYPLRGLKGVHVEIEGMKPEAERLGLTTNQIKTDVELRLRKAGIKVLTEKESPETPGIPSLYVSVFAQIAQGFPYVAVSVSVILKEWVTLERGFRTHGIIWTSGSAGIVESRTIGTIRNNVNDLVDQFINDYLAANPKK